MASKGVIIVNQFIPRSARARGHRPIIFVILVSIIFLVSSLFVGSNSARASLDEGFTDLGVIKLGSDSVAPSGNITYTITAVNAGPDPATATLTDNLPAGTTFVSLSAPAAWSCTTPPVNSGGTVTCIRAAFPVGASEDLTLVIKANSEATPGSFITNTATIASDVPDSTDENDNATTSTLVTGGTRADVQVTKTANSDFAFADTDVTFTVTVLNAGPSTAANVSFTDTLDNGAPSSPMVFGSFTAPAGWSCPSPSNTTTCSIASLPANSPQVFTLVAHIPNGTASGTTYTNQATLSPSDSDPNSENNSAAAAVTVVDHPDLTVTKSHAGSFKQGDNGDAYTITVSNTSVSPSVGAVTLSESLPAGLIARSLSGTGWNCDSIPVGGTPGPATLNCTRSDSLSGGNSYNDLTLTVDVSCNAAASLTNRATVSGGGDLTPGNNTANDPTSISPDATPPTIVCPGSISRFVDSGQNGATINPGLPVATDNCNVTITGIRSDGKPLNALYPVGVTIITWTAKDTAGNTASCAQSIVVMVPSSNRRPHP